MEIDKMTDQEIEALALTFAEEESYGKHEKSLGSRL
jgi:hypothetical protein